MKNIILDIETVPQSSEALEAMMPADIAKPEMPAELANPIEPDWELKCPKYGGDETKRQTWIKDSVRKWASAHELALDKWRQTSLESRARFIESAALRAETGHVKMIGLSVNDERTIYLWETDRKLVDIAEKEAVSAKVALFSPFMREDQMFHRFAKDFMAMMGFESVIKVEDHPVLITYYGNTFDLPFIARRSAICGECNLMKFLRAYRRGRYLNSDFFIDLHEEWTAGDRETKTGGLEGLAKILGAPITKNGNGASFYHWYQADPAEGVRYLLNDLSMTEECAKRMGIL
jgi:hypothetical protein